MAVKAGLEIAKALRARLPRAWRDEDHDEDHHDIIWELENISASEAGTARDHLRAVIEALYDWADIKRVWLG